MSTEELLASYRHRLDSLQIVYNATRSRQEKAEISLLIGQLQEKIEDLDRMAKQMPETPERYSSRTVL